MTQLRPEQTEIKLLTQNKNVKENFNEQQTQNKANPKSIETKTQRNPNQTR